VARLVRPARAGGTLRDQSELRFNQGVEERTWSTAPNERTSPPRILGRGLAHRLLKKPLNCRNADEREVASQARMRYKIDVERFME
jgi:hypothetical protein